MWRLTLDAQTATCFSPHSVSTKPQGRREPSGATKASDMKRLGLVNDSSVGRDSDVRIACEFEKLIKPAQFRLASHFD
jgi:hypothetical protein